MDADYVGQMLLTLHDVIFLFQIQKMYKCSLKLRHLPLHVRKNGQTSEKCSIIMTFFCISHVGKYIIIVLI